MTVEDFSTENLFYCRDAGERFLGEESVDLFIGHPPYYMEELERNGGDPAKQMQSSGSLDEYWDRLVSSIIHMEHALKEEGHIFFALQNTSLGLGVLPKIASKTSLELQNIRMWDYSGGSSSSGNNTVLFAHYTKKTWGPGDLPQGPFVLTNSWEEAYAEVAPYHLEYSTIGAAPSGLYREIIENFSKKGDIVCDLFAGCGTVQVVSLELGRRFIYNDVSEDKVIMARKRVEDYIAGLSSAG